MTALMKFLHPAAAIAQLGFTPVFVGAAAIATVFFWSEDSPGSHS